MIKILIVEDDPMVADINKKFIAKLPFCQLAGIAASIGGAKKAIGQQEIDLILLDVFLPDGKGIDYLKWLRKEEYDVDVLLITADKSADSVAIAFRYGVVGYLVKPFRFERLKEVLENYQLQKRLRLETELSQEEIDNYSHQSRHQANLTKQVEEMNVTYQRIIEFIKQDGNEGVTAQEVADCLNLSRVTARKYLERMEKSNILTLQLDYSGIGRPKNVYQLIKERT